MDAGQVARFAASSMTETSAAAVVPTEALMVLRPGVLIPSSSDAVGQACGSQNYDDYLHPARLVQTSSDFSGQFLDFGIFLPNDLQPQLDQLHE